MYRYSRLATKTLNCLVVIAILLTSVPAPMSITARAARPASADESAAESPTVDEVAVESPVALPLGSQASPALGAAARSSAVLPTFQSPLSIPEPQSAEPGVRLYAITNPPVLELGARAVCTVTVVNEDVADLEGVTLSAPLPTGLIVADDPSAREWQTTVGDLAMGDTRIVTLSLRLNGQAWDPFEFEIALRDGDDNLRATTTAIVGVDRPGVGPAITPAGGSFAAGNGRVRADFPPGALGTSAQVSARVHRQGVVFDRHRIPDPGEPWSWGGTLLHFNIEAQDEQTEAEIETFAQPVTLTVDLRGLVGEEGLPLGWDPFLAHVADPETGELERVAATFDSQTGLLTAQVDHFSDWVAGTTGEGWQPVFSPAVPDLFSGALTYNYPIQVPPGRNGLQPQVSLGYNSRGVDGMVRGGDVDSGPIGLGWSVGGTIEVVRKMRFVSDGGNYILNLYDDFTLVLNGASHPLEPQSPNQECGRYWARNAPGVYVERINNSTDTGCGNGSTENQTTEYWIVRQPDGTELRLGYTENAEVAVNTLSQLLDCHDNFCAVQSGYGANRWRVDQITDATGNNRIEYTYTKESQSGPSSSHYQRSRIAEIRYNNYGSNQWLSKVVFEQSDDPMRIGRISVWHGGARQRYYELTTGYRSEYIEPWTISEWAVEKIQEFSGDSSISLPATEFDLELREHSSEGFRFRHISAVENGYGGWTEFIYQRDGREIYEYGQPVFGYSFWVSEVRTYDGSGGTPTLARYDYSAPCYKSDPPSGATICTGRHPKYSLVGHAQVIETAFDFDGVTPLVETTHYFSVENGEYGYRQGKEYQTQIRSGAGELLRQTDTTWGNIVIGPTTFAHVDQVDATDFSGGASITTRVQYEHDDYGNVIAEYHRGDIAVSGDGHSVHHLFYPNDDPDTWIVNKVALEAIYQGDVPYDDDPTPTTAEAITRYCYDQRGYTKPPVQGALTKVRRGDGDAFGFVNTEYEYDTWGNLTAEIDPNGNRTEIDYDTTYHLYPVETYNALGDCTETRYFGIDNIPVDFGLIGQVKKVIDPNGAETKYGYDALGRLTDVIRPGDSRDYPSVSYQYDLVTESAYIYGFETNCSAGALPDGWGQSGVNHVGCATASAYAGNWGVYLEGPIQDEKGRLHTHSNLQLDANASYRVRMALKGSGGPGRTVRVKIGGQSVFLVDPQGSWKIEEGMLHTGSDGLSGQFTIWTLPPEDNVDVDVDQIQVERVTGLRVIETVREESGASGGTRPTISFYDGWGRLVETLAERTDGGEQILSYTTYDALGRVDKEYISYVVNDDFWNFKPLDPAQPHTTYTYDALGRVVQVVNPDGTAGSTMYAGLYTSQVDANGHYKFAVSDAFGRLTRVDETATTLEEPFSSLNSSTWTFSGHQSIDGGTLKNTGTGSNYNANFYRTSYSLSAGESIKVEFKVNQGDTSAHFSLETSDGGVYRRWGVIANSNKIYVQFKNGGGWQYPADLINPVQVGKWYVLTLKVGADGTFYTELWQKDDPAVRGAYAGQMASGKNWRFHHWVYRGTAWLDNYHELDYQSTDYAYDILDNLTSVTDAAGNVTTMTYDPLGRKTEMDDPDMGHWYYQYDDAGNLKRQRDARGQRVCFYYDPLNRLTGKHYRSDDSCPSIPTLDASYTYDQGTNGIGRRTRMDDGSGYTTWTYDGRGRMTKETKVINGTGGGTFVTRWDYDAMDRVTWTKYPGGSGGQQGEYVYNTYNTQGLVDSVHNGTDVYVSSTSYDAAGRVDLRILGNNRRTDYVYYPWTTANGLGRVKYIKTGTTSSATSLQHMYYVYDAVGNVTQIKDYKAGGTQTQSFTYDALDRLKTAAASGGSGGTYGQKGYSYNAIGNITNFEGMAYAYQDGNHKHAVTHLGGVQKYWYDANGNQTKRITGSGTYYLTHDAENRLTSVSGAASATFVYDGDGNRVKATFGSATTVYVGNYYEKQGSTVRKYYYAGGTRVAVRENGTLYYLLSDHLGSTAITVNSTGTTEVGELRYYPYGGTRYTSGTTPTSYRFTGQREDATIGLYFYNARFYDATLGRFISADTIVPNPSDPQSFNRYSYTGNNPLRYIDPTGHIYGPDKYDPAGLETMEEAYAFAQMSGDSSVLEQYKPYRRPNLANSPIDPSSITTTPKMALATHRLLTTRDMAGIRALVAYIVVLMLVHLPVLPRSLWIMELWFVQESVVLWEELTLVLHTESETMSLCMDIFKMRRL